MIVPAHRAEKTIQSCLHAIFSSGFARESVLVVNDGSPDRTGDIAHETGVRVLTHETPRRPSGARNSGVANTDGEILVFIDSDVIVHPGMRARLESHFSDPSLTGVIGSYDDLCGGTVVSRYRNLLHHLTHQAAAGPTPTFWSGIGALRRSAFDAAGGFNSEWEDIEDVELGLRVSATGGRILLDPDMLGTHLKEWTLQSMFRTDLLGRAVPWTRLLRSGRVGIGTLNTAWPHRVSGASACLAFITLPAAVFDVRLLWLTAAAFVVFIVVNVGFLRRLAEIGGPFFALRALPFHALHYTAAVLGYARVRIFERQD